MILAILAALVWALLTPAAIDGPLILAVALVVIYLIRLHYIERQQS